MNGDVIGGLGRSAFLADVGSDDRRLWRIALTLPLGVVTGLLAAAVCFIVIVVIWLAATGQTADGLRALGGLMVAMKNADGHDLNSALLLLVIAAPTNLAAFVTFVAVAAALARRPFRSYVTAAGKVRWRLGLLGLGMAAVATAPLLILDRMFSSGHQAMPIATVSHDGLVRAIYAAAALCFLLPAAAAEELLFRGWMVKQFAAFTRRPVVLIMTTSLIFSIFHLLPVSSTLSRFVPDLIGNMLQDPGGLIFRALLGAGYAYMTLRLGGIEFATGAHAANNILIVIFVEPLTQKALTTAGDTSAGSFFQYAALLAIYFAITEAVARLAPLRRWAGVRLDEVSPLGMEPHTVDGRVGEPSA
jgi:membrane protease YdiL (CAAX protease family)